jgi:4-alpha-glucanotransferase
MKRSSGILMPVSSLPSPYGIGTLGQEARNFVDFLEAAGQGWWQMLPVGHTSYGDSPYQCPSSFAGNPYFIDLDELIADGLLTQEEVDAVNWGGDPQYVDYGAIYENRFRLLAKATERGFERDREAFEAFASQNPWLAEYSLFMAIKKSFGMISWVDWPDEGLRRRDPGSLERARRELADDVRLYSYIQFLFFKQWNALRDYAHAHGVKIIGDLPIYVALDSADVWAETVNFQLGDDLKPKEVSGVPPDYFNEDGQLWGNPLYNYDFMRWDGYGWWIRRIDGAAKLYDVIRIDHFRGFESYWAVPFGETTARNGHWVKGPGLDLIDRLKGWFRNVEFIAEDLGFATPEVEAMLKGSGFPGMRVLQFAFDNKKPGDYLPHNQIENCVCYTGTHDNATLMEWLGEAPESNLRLVREYLGLPADAKPEELADALLRAGMSGPAKLFVSPLSDWLCLGAEAKLNVPGTLGWWRWRLQQGQITPQLAQRIARMTKLYGRAELELPQTDASGAYAPGIDENALYWPDYPFKKAEEK